MISPPQQAEPGRDGVLRERGSTSLEAAIVIPTFLLFVLLLAFAARVSIAHHSVQAAAAAAARSATLSRTADQARAAAASAAAASLANEGLRCLTTDTTIDTSAFAASPGTAALVEATVSCTVPLNDLALPGAPGTRVITAVMASPLDTYRARN